MDLSVSFKRAEETRKRRKTQTHLLQRLPNKLPMLQRNVLLNKLPRREELVTFLAPELALLFLLNVRLNEAVELLVARLATEVTDVDR
jgi:hypothetical protein